MDQKIEKSTTTTSAAPATDLAFDAGRIFLLNNKCQRDEPCARCGHRDIADPGLVLGQYVGDGKFGIVCGVCAQAVVPVLARRVGVFRMQWRALAEDCQALGEVIELLALVEAEPPRAATCECVKYADIMTHEELVKCIAEKHLPALDEMHRRAHYQPPSYTAEPIDDADPEIGARTLPSDAEKTDPRGNGDESPENKGDGA